MSPLTLRRYRAERLLREEFEALQGRVLARGAGRLAGSGVSLDQSDLEACYAQAWQGLYAAMLDGQEIANPRGLAGARDLPPGDRGAPVAPLRAAAADRGRTARGRPAREGAGERGLPTAERRPRRASSTTG